MSLSRRAYDLLRGYVNSEWDRIHSETHSSAEEELTDALNNPAPRKIEGTPPLEAPIGREERARRVLGVSPLNDFAEVRRTFERIHRRADPSNFPPGSEEASQARDIQKQVEWAYGVLTENVDTTEKRFRSLEIE